MARFGALGISLGAAVLIAKGIQILAGATSNAAFQRQERARQALEREAAEARELAEARERVAAAARVRKAAHELAEAREREGKQAQEREAASILERAEALALEKEVAAARERQAAEARARKAAAARERELEEAREREAAAARERELEEARARKAAAEAQERREQHIRATKAKEPSPLKATCFTSEDPTLEQLQKSILAADDTSVINLLAVRSSPSTFCLQGEGVGHPDSIMLGEGLTPFLLAALACAFDEAADRKLWQIMGHLLKAGASITQRFAPTGITALHILANQPTSFCVQHRICGMLQVLNDYRLGSGQPLAGLSCDSELNSTRSSSSGLTRELAVHPLGMRDVLEMLPEDRASGSMSTMLRMHRLQLPVQLQGCKRDGAT